MIETIISTDKPITLVGGAPITPSLLNLALNLAPQAVGVDGGANILLTLGKMPIAVIGDMDSIQSSVVAQIPRKSFHHILDQETTDFEKSLLRIETPMLIGVGFLGARIDHQMAAQTVLVRYPHMRCLLLGNKDLMFVIPPDFTLNLDAGVRVSLFPMAACRVKSIGLQWPTNEFHFAPDGQVGISNKSTGVIRLTPESPKMLAILPLNCLDKVKEALMEAPQWPK